MLGLLTCGTNEPDTLVTNMDGPEMYYRTYKPEKDANNQMKNLLKKCKYKEDYRKFCYDHAQAECTSLVRILNQQVFHYQKLIIFDIDGKEELTVTLHKERTNISFLLRKLMDSIDWWIKLFGLGMFENSPKREVTKEIQEKRQKIIAISTQVKQDAISFMNLLLIARRKTGKEDRCLIHLASTHLLMSSTLLEIAVDSNPADETIGQLVRIYFTLVTNQAQLVVKYILEREYNMSKQLPNDSQCPYMDGQSPFYLYDNAANGRIENFKKKLRFKVNTKMLPSQSDSDEDFLPDLDKNLTLEKLVQPKREDQKQKKTVEDKAVQTLTRWISLTPPEGLDTIHFCGAKTGKVTTLKRMVNDQNGEPASKKSRLD